MAHPVTGLVSEGAMPVAGTVEVVAASRDDALADLFRSDYARLVGTARLLVDDRGQAEEVVQEAFVRLHASWRRLREPDKAAAYLRATVVNLARGRLRHRRVVERHRPEPDGTVTLPEEAALDDDRHRRVLAEVATLPRRQRECVVLRYYLDLPEREIAAALGISGGSVKTHLHRGLAALAERLTEQQP
jgi:RNA polymerase sigma-70 factor (sigma-E family)